MGYTSKDVERNEILGYINNTLRNQNEVLKDQKNLLKYIDVGISNIVYAIENKNKETLFVGNAFTGLHLTKGQEPLFIPVDKILYISGSRIYLTHGGISIDVDQNNEEIIEEIAVNC